MTATSAAKSAGGVHYLLDGNVEGVLQNGCDTEDLKRDEGGLHTLSGERLILLPQVLQTYHALELHVEGDGTANTMVPHGRSLLVTLT